VVITVLENNGPKEQIQHGMTLWTYSLTHTQIHQEWKDKNEKTRTKRKRKL